MRWQPRLRLRTLIGLVAASALGLSIWEHRERDSARHWSRVVVGGRDDQSRWEAARALGKRPETDAGVAVPALIRSLVDGHSLVRTSAAEALGRFTSEAERSVPALCEAIRGRDEVTSMSAIGAVTKLSADSPGCRRAALEGLKPSLVDPRPRVRLGVAALMGELGAGKQVRPGVVRDLEDRTPAVRVLAVRTLRGLGPEACKVEWEGLLARLADDEPDVVIEAAAAVGGTHPVQATLALARSFRPSEFDFRNSVQGVLDSVGSKADAAGELAGMVATGDRRARSGALVVLQATGPDASAAIPAVVAALRDDAEPLTRQNAASALGIIGVGNSAAFDALVRQLRYESDGEVRRCITSSLDLIGPLPTP